MATGVIKAVASKAAIDTLNTNKQDKTDNNLYTTDKTIVGAINENRGGINAIKAGYRITNESKMGVLSQNVDLNNYTAPETWVCSSGTIAATISNTPVTDKAFVLQIEQAGGGVMQTVISMSNDVYIRYRKNGSGQSWSSWDSLALNSNLTSKFKVTEIGPFASESALATGLSTQIGTMTNGEVAFIQFQMSAATTNFGAYAYVGTLTRVAATYASFSVSVATSGTISHTVVGSMNNGTWKMEQVSLNSNATLYNLGEGTKSEMESALVTAGNNMKVNVQGIRFGITSASSPFQSTTYLGKLMRYSSGRYVVQANGITSPDQDIIGVYRSSTWYWTSINSKMLPESLGTMTSLADIGSKLLTFSNSLSLYEVRTASGTVNGAYAPFTQTSYSFTVRKLDANRSDVMAFRGNTMDVIVGNCLNGTWIWDTIAFNSKIENNSTTELSNSGLGCTYIKRGGYCYARISGTPTTTSNITFTVPQALIGAYVTCGQWASTSNQMQVYIDANTTTLTIRNHALVGVNVIIMYPYA